MGPSTVAEGNLVLQISSSTRCEIIAPITPQPSTHPQTAQISQPESTHIRTESTRKQKDPTKQYVWYPPDTGPENQNVRSSCLCGIFRVLNDDSR